MAEAECYKKFIESFNFTMLPIFVSTVAQNIFLPQLVTDLARDNIFRVVSLIYIYIFQFGLI